MNQRSDKDMRLEDLRRDIAFSEQIGGQTYRFRSTWGLFSPRALDEGTRLLLEQMPVGEADDCLDLGCGYGPIGVFMARNAPLGQTLLVDKDFVAIEYARKNIELNGLTNCAAVLSNGFDQLGDKRYDLIASNVPAKVGRELLLILLTDAHARLRSGGRIYVVTINGLREFIKRNLNEVFGNYKKVKQGPSYTLATASRTG